MGCIITRSVLLARFTVGTCVWICGWKHDVEEEKNEAAKEYTLIYTPRGKAETGPGNSIPQRTKVQFYSTQSQSVSVSPIPLDVLNVKSALEYMYVTYLHTWHTIDIPSCLKQVKPEKSFSSCIISPISAYTTTFHSQSYKSTRRNIQCTRTLHVQWFFDK